jgi:DNA-binding CsgD family transcriptional regulator
MGKIGGIQGMDGQAGQMGLNKLRILWYGVPIPVLKEDKMWGQTRKERGRTRHMPDQKLREKDSSFSYLVSILGFGLCRAWIVFCLSLPLAGSQFTDSWVYLVAGAAAALAIPLAMPRIASRLGFDPARLRLAVFRLTTVFLVAGAVLIPCALWTAYPVLLLAGWLIGGVGAGLLQILWGERFAAHSARFSLTVAPAAAILTAVMVALATSEAALIVLFVLPLISLFLLVLVSPSAPLVPPATPSPSTPAPLVPPEPDVPLAPPLGSELPVPPPAPDALPAPAPGGQDGVARTGGFEPAVWKLMFSILVFSLICRAFDALPVEDSGLFEALGGGVLLALFVVGCTFLVLVALLKERFNVALTYRLSLPLMMVGFAVLALFVNSYAAMSLFLINMGYEFFDILSWILFAEIARRDRSRALHVFGLGVAFTFMGMALGYVFGDRFVGLLVNDVTQGTGVVLLCMVALVLVAFLVIPEGTILHLTGSLFAERKAVSHSASAGAETDAAAAGAAAADVTETGAAGEGYARPLSIEQVCERVAASHCLTAREGDVLVLLARGRTLAIIARELSIAKGTARTHIERVYAKLGVHKQQELIDLIEDFGKEGAD